MKLLWWLKRKLFFTEEFSLLNNKEMTKCQVILQPPKKQMLEAMSQWMLNQEGKADRSGWSQKDAQ